MESTDSLCIGDNTAVEFLDGALSDAQVKQVERHAARCDTCRRLLAELGRSQSQDGEAPTAPMGSDAYMTLERGQQVGRFMVLNRIGAGGMGVVFAAYDPKLDRKVALKLLRSPKEGAISVEAAQMRLMREAQAIARLSHPNVISVYDVGTYESEVYIAMEFVEGDTMTKWLCRWERSWRDILHKFLQAGSALAEAHAAGLMHRDFKPDNMLVGNDERVRVMDFGLARSLFFDATAAPLRPAQEMPFADSHGVSAYAVTLPGTGGGNMLHHPLTNTGALVGTPRYMAPEQIEGGDSDARADQFSFCVALYEALYGQHPFEGETAIALLHDSDDDSMRRPRPPPPGTSVPDWLHQALLRGLSLHARDRFPAMNALLRELTPPQKQPWGLRYLVTVIVAVLALITSAYAVPALIGATSDNETLDHKVQKAEKLAKQLQDQVAVLSTEIKSRDHQSRQQSEEILYLKKTLTVARQALEQAEQELADIRQRTDQSETRKRRRSRSNQVLLGLQEDELTSPLTPVHTDLDACLQEWIDREHAEHLAVNVDVTIDSDGTPFVDKVDFNDRVVRQCIGPHFERLRFPRKDNRTMARYRLSCDRKQEIAVLAEVIEVLPPLEQFE